MLAVGGLDDAVDNATGAQLHVTGLAVDDERLPVVEQSARNVERIARIVGDQVEAGAAEGTVQVDLAAGVGGDGGGGAPVGGIAFQVERVAVEVQCAIDRRAAVVDEVAAA